MTNAFMILDMSSTDFFDTTGKRVRILRDDRRLNQTEMAQRMREFGAPVDPSYLSQIEAGTKMPRLRAAIELEQSAKVQLQAAAEAQRQRGR